MDRRPWHRKNQEDRRAETECRARRPDRLAARQSNAARENHSSRPWIRSGRGGGARWASVQESLGKAGPVPTYEDMLKSPHDEDLFEYYATAQLAKVDAATGAITPLGKPGL